MESVVPPSQTEPIMPVLRFVNIGRDRDVRDHLEDIQGGRDCAEVIDRRNREEKQSIADLVSSEPNRPLNSDDGAEDFRARWSLLC